MLFSIVIPVYNVEKYLNECVQSVISQIKNIDYDCEIILVDDGSTDKSGEICDEYKKQYPDIIKVYHKSNEGLLLTRRYGFRRALGEYIINCDSDDLLEPNMMNTIKRVINKYNKPDIIIMNYNNYNNGNKTVFCENKFTTSHDCLVEREDILREFMKSHSIVSVCSKVVKRNCINKDLDYENFGRLNTGEDTLQSIEFYSNAKTYVYLNEALYDYRCGSGMTAKFDENYFFTFKRIFEEIQKQKVIWDLNDFDFLLAIKVLQTVGRSITQSRLKIWNHVSEQVIYLQKIQRDNMVQSSLNYLNKSREYLQFDHLILLKMLKDDYFILICFLLRVKNFVRR